MEQAAADLGQYSHPASDVRHSYPLAIRDASFGAAAALFLKTIHPGVGFSWFLVLALAAGYFSRPSSLPGSSPAT